MRSSLATENVTVYYFPGNSKSPFGHIAIGGFPRHNTFAPAGYLSYGMGEGQARDYLKFTDKGRTYEYPITAEGENETYTGFTKINLPSCNREKFLEAIKNFGERQRSDYNILSNNCANAVLGFLRDMDLVSKDSMFISPVRPQAIALQSCDIVLDSIKAEREAILAATHAPALSQIEDLIENDIKRLKTQIMRDEISHLSWYKNADKKTEKIHILNQLRDLLAEAKLSRDPKDFEKCYRAMIEAEHLGSTKTKHNLETCISLFPKEYVVDVSVTQLKDYMYYKNHRKDILLDDIAPVDKIKNLIQNDIYRLDAQLSQNVKSFFTSKDASTQKKTTKINALSNLLNQLKDPINYTELLQALEKALHDKAMAGETSSNLKDCIELYPYEKLPAITPMFNYLIKLDSFLADQLANTSSNHHLFSEYRHMFPAGEEAICSMEPRETYQTFMKIADKLSEQVSTLSPKTSSNLTTFVQTFNEMAKTVTATNETPSQHANFSP